WIAKIEMVGNEWEEVGIAPSENESYVVKSESFSVSVVNSEDNPDTYEAPKGVQGEYDRINEIRMKEQSLVLWFDGEEGLQPGALCAAKKVLQEEGSFITYRKMKLYVNGSNLHTRNRVYQNGEKTPLQFFIKFGRLDEKYPLHYYEYRQPIYPGWDTRNKMEIDLDFITQLKSYNTEESFPDNDQHPKRFRIYYNDSGEIVKRHYREVKSGKYTGVEVIIVGNAALSRVPRIDIGLKNQKYSLDDLTESVPYSRYDNTMYGEVWLDELRLSEVRRDAGIAYRTKASLKLADLATIDISIDRRDADFHTVEQRPSLTTDALNTTESFRIQGRISLDKFTPSSWGVRLPVTGSYSQNVSTPKYIPGQDVLVGDAPPDSILNISHSYSMNVSYEKRVSDYWLTKYTIDQIKAGFSAQWANNSSVTIRDNDAQNYKANMSYRVPFGKENYFKIFKWMSPVPYLGTKLGEVRWYYTPSNLDFSFDAAEDIKNTVTRGSASDTTYTHNLGMNCRANLSYKFFDNLNLTYSKDMKNNMNELKNDKWQAVQRLNFGVPVSVRENYSASFSPKIFSWLSPNITYTSNYSWAEPMGSETKSIDQLSNQNRVSTSFQLDLASILNSVYSPAKTPASRQPATSRTPTRGRSGRSDEEQSESPGQPGQLGQSGQSGQPGRPEQQEQPGQQTQPAQTDNKKGVVKQELDEPKQIKSLDILSKYLKKLSAIQFSYSFSQSVNSKYRTGGTPGIAYRMGFTPDPGLAVVEAEKGVGKDNITTGMDATIRSGLNISPNINTSLSFAQNISVTNSAGQTGRNLSRDFFPMGKNGKDGFPFPNWTIGWKNLEKMKLLNKVFKKLSLDHGFSGKEALVWKNGKEMNSSYKIYFQPLLSVNMQFKNDMTATARMTQGSTINNRDAATEIVDEMNIQTTVNFQKKGGFTIPLPFLKDKRLENNITFALTYDYSASRRRARATNEGKFVVQSENNSWKIAPRINYSFTKKVTGGIYYEYGESFNRSSGRRTTKNGGFDINIAIRG
ncbi:MAG: cell surface protein SprA, partial [Candidatus Neomarinimicrobiota bacterium]